MVFNDTVKRYPHYDKTNIKATHQQKTVIYTPSRH